jgi:hypothetical protein
VHRAAAAQPEYVLSYESTDCSSLSPLKSWSLLFLRSGCTLAKNAANTCLGVAGLSAPAGALDVG